MNLAHARQSITGAWRLLLRDPRGWDAFDTTVEGFYRSFGAVFFLMPLNILFDLYAMRLSEARGRSMAGGDGPGYGLAEMIFSTAALCLEWLLFPIVIYGVLRLLGLAHQYVRYVVAHNWGSVIVALFNLPAIVLFSLGLIGPTVAVDLMFLALLAVLYYRFIVARGALEAGWGVALGMAVLELLLTLFFSMGVSGASSLWLSR